MLGRTGRWLAFGLVICLLALFGGAGAEGLHRQVDNPVLETSVQLGYDGRITYGKPFPVRVTIRNGGEDLEGLLAVNAYASAAKYDRYEMKISVPAGGERTYVLPVKSEIQQKVFTAEILRNGEVIQAVNAEPDAVINPSAMMIGLLSTRPRNLAMLDISQENDALLRYEYWQTVDLSPETLPDDPELLGAFGMIVLDDLDPAQWTEKQQKALKEWIRQGHVLLCGGGSTAPRNLAFLGGTADLRAEEFTVSSGVHDALESFAERKSTGRKPEVAIARITGDAPLVSDADGNGLIWRETVGAGRVFVLAWEAGDAALNAESLMHSFYQQLLIKTDPNLYNNIQYASDGGSISYFSPGADNRVPVRNSLPLAAVLLGASAVACGAVWIVLQRKGAAKWMWAIVPAAALAMAAVIMVMAGGSALNRPVAAAAVNILQEEDGSMTRYTAVTAASPRTGLHRYYLEGEETDVQMYDDYYWYGEEEEETTEPVKLRMVRTSGGQREISVNAASPWEQAELRASRTEEGAGRVDAEIWMEQDGLHGTVANHTAFALKEGVVYCLFGFVRIPALKPGESADFAMLQAEAKDPMNPVFEDGKMIMNVTSGLYAVVYNIWNPTGADVESGSHEQVLAGMMNNATDQVIQRKNRSGGGQESAVFFYSAEPEDVALPALYADGKPVESIAVQPMLTAEAAYLSVGRTGVVFHTPGMDKAVRCMLNSEGLPMGDMEEAGGKPGYSYYTLSERPTFRFSPEGLEDMEITSLMIGVERWYVSDVKCYVLNVKQKKWVEFTPNTPLQLPQQYIDAGGNLYCQFRPAAGEAYAEMSAPTLTLEGRVKNAEN